MYEMKESGIEWIGQIPKHWEVNRLKYLFSFEKGLSITKEDLKENGISVISYGQLHSKLNKGIISDALIRHVDDTYLTISPQSLVNCGDFIFADTSEDYIGCGNNVYVDKDIILFAGYHTITLKATKYRNNKYLSYLFYTDYWRQQIRSKVFGIKLFSITQKILKETFVILPPLDEQEKIADFLDKKVSEIENLIDDTKKLIEKYREYKQSIITETVTKGLNSNVEMKESGIEWIGQIPKHWGISRLKYLFSFEKGLSITKEDLKENGTSVISYGQLHSKLNKGIISDELIRYIDETYLTIYPKSLVNCGDFIFADTSEDYMGCGNNVYVDKDIVLFAGYHTIILKATKYRNNKYLSYLFYTDYWRHQIRSKVFGIKLFSITQKILKETFVILPPLTEQEEIVKYLDDKCSQIDNIIEEKQLLLEKLEAYKKSLIYEYVTGKKQVENE